MREVKTFSSEYPDDLTKRVNEFYQSQVYSGEPKVEYFSNQNKFTAIVDYVVSQNSSKIQEQPAKQKNRVISIANSISDSAGVINYRHLPTL